MQACHQCNRLIKTKGLNINPTFKQSGRPIIEHMWDYPHRCVFSVLCRVQQMFQYGWMATEIFELWMGLNTCDYQIGKNDKLLSLWNDRKDPLAESRQEGRREVSSGVAGLDPGADEIQSSSYILVLCNEGYRHKHVRINWGAVRGRKSLKDLNKVFPWSSDADKSHTNVDVASLIYWITRQPADSYKKMRAQADKVFSILQTGMSNVTMCAWLIAIVGLSEAEHVISLAKADGACCLRKDQYPKYWKAVSTALRRTSRWEDGSAATLRDVVACSYFELPIGRSSNVSDWAEECSKRTKRVVHLKPPEVECVADLNTNTEYVTSLGSVLDGVMDELVLAADVWPTWEEAVQRRQSWVSAGSSGGARIVIDGKVERLNKQAYFETVDKEEMVLWMDQTPKIEAVASEKFEMGKARAIYGTKPVDYAIMSYVISSSERKLWRIDGVEAGLSGLDEVMCIVRRAAVAAREGVECTMIDYADFNYQHTLSAQAEVFWALHRRLVSIRAPDDMIRGCIWCARALLNQWCSFPNTKQAVRITQGMFSGCRGTNFINTILNVAYMRLATYDVERLLGLQPQELYSIHQGDDVWVSNMSRLWAASVYLILQKSGLIFQPGKQMFDRQRGEFLRVVYTSEGARGYPLRAIGTLIINPVQSTDVHAPQDRASALTSQVHLLYRRGLSEAAGKWVWDAVVRHALALPLPDGAGVAIPIRVAAATSATGGLELGPPGVMGCAQLPMAVLPRLEVNTRAMEAAVGTNMSGDWLSHMSSQIKESIDAKRVLEGLHQANVSGSVRAIDKKAGLRRYEKDLKKWVEGLPTIAGALWTQIETCTPADGMLSSIVARRLSFLRDPDARKQGWEKRGLIDTILAAIASGPFRDVNTVQKAMNMGIVEAAKYAVSLSASPRLRTGAISVINAVEMACGKEVLARILSGVGGVSRPWEAHFNPIILSWASKCAADLAIYDTIGSALHSSEAWDKELHDKRQIVLRMMLEDGMLVQLSHF